MVTKAVHEGNHHQRVANPRQVIADVWRMVCRGRGHQRVISPWCAGVQGKVEGVDCVAGVRVRERDRY